MILIEVIDGPFADRILSALNECRPEILVSLRTENHLRMKNSYTLTCKSLRLQSLDAYSTATGIPISQFFYSESDFLPNGNVDTCYTKNDQFVINALNTLSDSQLEAFGELLPKYYPNNRFYCSFDKPHYRLTEHLTTKVRGFLSEDTVRMQQEAGKPISSEIIADIVKIRKNNYSPFCVYNSNCWPDWATFAEVSLHWLFQLQSPLYCTRQTADSIFDRYVMMQPEEQSSFCDLLSEALSAERVQIKRILALREPTGALR